MRRRIIGRIFCATTRNMDIYVATTGNDSTGKGSVGNPYKTVIRALENVAPLIKHRIRILIGDGAYTDAFPSGVRREFTDKGCLTFEASGDPVIVDAGPYTATVTAIGMSSSAYKVVVTGNPWTNDQHMGCWIRMLSGANAGYLMPIFSNGTDNIICNKTELPIATGDTFEVVDTPVTITQTTGIGFRATDLDGHVQFGAPDQWNISRIGMAGILFKSLSAVDQPGSFQFLEGSYVVDFCRFLETGNDKAALGLFVGTIDYNAMVDSAVFLHSIHNNWKGWSFQVLTNDSVVPINIDATISLFGPTSILYNACTRGRIEVEHDAQTTLNACAANQVRVLFAKVYAAIYIDGCGIGASGMDLSQALVKLNLVHFENVLDAIIAKHSCISSIIVSANVITVTGYGLIATACSTYTSAYGFDPTGATGAINFPFSVPAAWPASGNGVNDGNGSFVLTE